MRPGRRELMLFGVAYLLYSLGRWVAIGDTDVATRHAHWIVDLERSASLDVEGTVQDSLIGLVDTITTQTGIALDSKLTTAFYNPLAAVPSLHAGFALAVSAALAASCRRTFTRCLAWLWAPTIALAVVATGNHFLFDIAAGVLATAAGFALGELVRRKPLVLRRDPLPAPA